MNQGSPLADFAFAAFMVLAVLMIVLLAIVVIGCTAFLLLEGLKAWPAFLLEWRKAIRAIRSRSPIVIEGRGQRVANEDRVRHSVSKPELMDLGP